MGRQVNRITELEGLGSFSGYTPPPLGGPGRVSLARMDILPAGGFFFLLPCVGWAHGPSQVLCPRQGTAQAHPFRVEAGAGQLLLSIDTFVHSFKNCVCVHVHAGDVQALGSVCAVSQGVTELVLGGETPLMDCCLGGVSLSS